MSLAMQLVLLGLGWFIGIRMGVSYGRESQRLDAILARYGRDD